MEQGKRTAIIFGRILSTLVILFMIVDGIGHVPRQSSSLSGSWTATHVRMGQPFYFPVVFGVLTWLALYLRDSRLRTFIPLTNS